MNYVHPPNKQHYYEQVWSLVRQIPHGRVATYGQIAQFIPQPEAIEATDYKASAARWVGLALAACPEDIPWQRVINSQGKVSDRPDAGRQRKLLEDEGISFFKGRLDLNTVQWSGPGQNNEPRQGTLF